MPGAKPNGQPGAGKKEGQEDPNLDEQDPTNNEDDENPGDDDDDDDGGNEGDDEVEGLDDKAKAIIKNLRKENAKSRLRNREMAQKLSGFEGTLGALKKALGVEGDDESPEEKVKTLSDKTAALEMELQLTNLSRELEIPRDQEKYFRFLLNERLAELDEGEELTEEELEEVAQQAKSVSSKKAGNNSTGLNGKGGGQPPAKGGELSVEDFARMNPGEKSALYVKNPGLYNKLFAAANEKGLL